MDDFRGRISQSIYMKDSLLNSKGGSQQNCFKIYNPASVSPLFPQWSKLQEGEIFPEHVWTSHHCSDPPHSAALLLLGLIILVSSCPWHLLWLSQYNPGLNHHFCYGLGLQTTMPGSQALRAAGIFCLGWISCPESWSQEKIICNGRLGKEDEELPPLSDHLPFHMCSFFFSNLPGHQTSLSTLLLL